MMLAQMPAGEAMPAGTEDGKQDSAIAAGAAENTAQQAETAGEEQQSEQAASGEQSATAAEMEEVEHEGKKYKIPRPLKGALLMQADYSRKTEELAEQRRAVEEQHKQFAERQKLEAEFSTEFARVVAYNDAIAKFENADWPQIRANNAAQYEQRWVQYQQTKEARDRAATALQ